MKVYVDELPKSCEKCKFYEYEIEHNGEWGFETHRRMCKINGSLIQGICPLQSLADYTKQVRKEVLDQVYKVFTTESMWKELKDWWLQSGTCQELKDCLNAIVEETSVENIVKRFGHDSKLYQLLDQIQGKTNE